MDLCARVSTYRMATVQELVAVGEQIGLKGEELKAFIKEQQMLEREARMKEREAREREQELIREREKDAKEAREKELVKEDRERAFELEKLKLEHEIRVTELQAMKTGSQAGSEVGDDERTGSDTERSGYSGSRVVDLRCHLLMSGMIWIHISSALKDMQLLRSGGRKIRPYTCPPC